MLLLAQRPNKLYRQQDWAYKATRINIYNINKHTFQSKQTINATSPLNVNVCKYSN